MPTLRAERTDYVPEKVKVCNTCGDAGFNDCLALCSRCNEGAEHVYCMVTVFDTVPQAWACEGCKVKLREKRGQQRFVGDGPPPIKTSKKQVLSDSFSATSVKLLHSSSLKKETGTEHTQADRASSKASNRPSCLVQSIEGSNIKEERSVEADQLPLPNIPSEKLANGNSNEGNTACMVVSDVKELPHLGISARATFAEVSSCSESGKAVSSTKCPNVIKETSPKTSTETTCSHSNPHSASSAPAEVVKEPSCGSAEPLDAAVVKDTLVITLDKKTSDDKTVATKEQEIHSVVSAPSVEVRQHDTSSDGTFLNSEGMKGASSLETGEVLSTCRAASLLSNPLLERSRSYEDLPIHMIMSAERPSSNLQHGMIHNSVSMKTESSNLVKTRRQRSFKVAIRDFPMITQKIKILGEKVEKSIKCKEKIPVVPVGVDGLLCDLVVKDNGKVINDSGNKLQVREEEHHRQRSVVAQGTATGKKTDGTCSRLRVMEEGNTIISGSTELHSLPAISTLSPKGEATWPHDVNQKGGLAGSPSSLTKGSVEPSKTSSEEEKAQPPIVQQEDGLVGSQSKTSGSGNVANGSRTAPLNPVAEIGRNVESAVLPHSVTNEPSCGVVCRQEESLGVAPGAGLNQTSHHAEAKRFAKRDFPPLKAQFVLATHKETVAEKVVTPLEDKTAAVGRLSDATTGKAARRDFPVIAPNVLSGSLKNDLGSTSIGNPAGMTTQNKELASPPSRRLDIKPEDKGCLGNAKQECGPTVVSSRVMKELPTNGVANVIRGEVVSMVKMVPTFDSASKGKNTKKTSNVECKEGSSSEEVAAGKCLMGPHLPGQREDVVARDASDTQVEAKEGFVGIGLLSGGEGLSIRLNSSLDVLGGRPSRRQKGGTMEAVAASSCQLRSSGNVALSQQKAMGDMPNAHLEKVTFTGKPIGAAEGEHDAADTDYSHQMKHPSGRQTLRSPPREGRDVEPKQDHYSRDSRQQAIDSGSYKAAYSRCQRCDKLGHSVEFCEADRQRERRSMLPPDCDRELPDNRSDLGQAQRISMRHDGPKPWRYDTRREEKFNNSRWRETNAVDCMRRGLKRPAIANEHDRYDQERSYALHVREEARINDRGSSELELPYSVNDKKWQSKPFQNSLECTRVPKRQMVRAQAQDMCKMAGITSQGPPEKPPFVPANLDHGKLFPVQGTAGSLLEAGYDGAPREGHVTRQVPNQAPWTSQDQAPKDRIPPTLVASGLHGSSIRNFAEERRAAPDRQVIWTGCFTLFSKTRWEMSYQGMQASPSNTANSKVFETLLGLPSRLEIEEKKRGIETDTWPRCFQESPPTSRSIGVYFFPTDMESYGRWYKPILRRLADRDLALRVMLDCAELLIFPSQLLPEPEQCWEDRFFLWGIFRSRKVVENPSRLLWRPSERGLESDVGSPAGNGEVIDMEIDMMGGQDTVSRERQEEFSPPLPPGFPLAAPPYPP